jgi:hypothetical protein
MTRRRYKSLDEFWPYYVGEHSRRLTRIFHFIGNTNLFIWLFMAMLRRRPRYVIWGVISSYIFAWIGHFYVERNRPATFEYPVLSALADMRMYGLMLRGEMRAEVEKYAKKRGVTLEPEFEIELEPAALQEETA